MAELSVEDFLRVIFGLLSRWTLILPKQVADIEPQSKGTNGAKDETDRGAKENDQHGRPHAMPVWAGGDEEPEKYGEEAQSHESGGEHHRQESHEEGKQDSTQVSRERVLPAPPQSESQGSGDNEGVGQKSDRI